MRVLILLLFAFPVAAEQVRPALAELTEHAALKVYKSPTCGCCGKWIEEHAEPAGFTAAVFHPRDLNRVKDQSQVPPQYRSCHTAVTSTGYVFEGHIPVKFILQFLAEPPDGAFGLAVPAMPVGSPGMEVGENFMPYQIYLLTDDGNHAVFADVTSFDQQH